MHFHMGNDIPTCRLAEMNVTMEALHLQTGIRYRTSPIQSRTLACALDIRAEADCGRGVKLRNDDDEYRYINSCETTALLDI
jgi:hypothetical protein